MKSPGSDPEYSGNNKSYPYWPQFFLGPGWKSWRETSAFFHLLLRKLLRFCDSSTKLYKIPVDTYRRLVLDPKNKAIEHGQNATDEVSSRNSDLNQPDNPTDKSMESSAERKADLVSDPNYPSFEILLDVAGKLLDSFDKH